MKRQGALPSLAVCLTAAFFHADVYAQGSVTLQGMIDGGVTYVNNQHGGSVTQFDSGIFAPNVLTFSASEDLGGGTTAIFNLTSQFDLGSGAAIPGAGKIFNRTSYVGLSDERLGAITFGNQYDFMFDMLTLGLFDGAFLFGGLHDFRQGPFSALGVPQNPTGSFDFDRLAGATRVANAVKYRSPTFAGFSFGALYGFGGIAGSFSANSTISAGMNYESGPLADRGRVHRRQISRARQRSRRNSKLWGRRALQVRQRAGHAAVHEYKEYGERGKDRCLQGGHILDDLACLVGRTRLPVHEGKRGAREQQGSPDHRSGAIPLFEDNDGVRRGRLSACERRRRNDPSMDQWVASTRRGSKQPFTDTGAHRFADEILTGAVRTSVPAVSSSRINTTVNATHCSINETQRTVPTLYRRHRRATTLYSHNHGRGPLNRNIR